MTQEEKRLLLKDICARLPYGVKIERTYVDYPTALHEEDIVSWKMGEIKIKPYLRPMSSMTEEERKEYENLFEYEEREYNQGCCFFDEYKIDIDDEYRLTTVIDWLNSHHFDFRGLIEKGLALEAPEDMYKTE